MKIEEALDFLSSNKSCMKLMGLEKVPKKGTVTKFRERMGAPLFIVSVKYAVIINRHISFCCLVQKYLLILIYPDIVR